VPDLVLKAENGNGVRHHHAARTEARPHAGGRPRTVSPTEGRVDPLIG